MEGRLLLLKYPIPIPKKGKDLGPLVAIWHDGLVDVFAFVLIFVFKKGDGATFDLS